MKKEYKIITIIVSFMIFAIGIPFIISKTDPIVKQLRYERDSMRTEMILQHDHNQLIIDSISNQNKMLSIKITVYDSLLIKHQEKYDNLLKQKLKDYEEITNASDSDLINKFLWKFPRN